MRAKSNVVILRAERAEKIAIFLTFAPSPIRNMDRRPCDLDTFFFSPVFGIFDTLFTNTVPASMEMTLPIPHPDTPGMHVTIFQQIHQRYTPDRLL